MEALQRRQLTVSYIKSQMLSGLIIFKNTAALRGATIGLSMKTLVQIHLATKK
jgi:hypothetical protein